MWDSAPRLSAEIEAIHQSAPVGLCVLDADLRYVRLNERMAEFNGIPAADHLGRTVRDIVPHMADEAEPRLRQVLQTGIPVRELEISGETVAQPGVLRTWIENCFPLKDEDDQVVGISIVTEEITRRKRAEHGLKESEAKLRRLFAQAPAFIAIHEGPDHVYIFSNRLHNSVVGHRPLFDKPLREAMPELSEQGIFERFDRVYETGEPVLTPQFQAVFDRDGDGALEEGYFSQILQPWYGLDGTVGGVMSFAFEVTDRVRAEAELHALNEDLERRVSERSAQVRHLASALTLAEQRERRRVAQILHDELKQQLYGIQIKLKMLLSDLGEVNQPVLQEGVEEVYVYVKEATETTEHLMVDLSPPVLKGEGLPEALQWLGAQMQQRYGLAMELSGADALSVPSDDMRVLLFQIVRELLFNVLKHAQTDSVRVLLEEEAAHLTIHVIDTGVGFDMQTLEQQPYTKSGFGLYSTQERIALFGGRMEIASDPGAGTHITIRLPVANLGWKTHEPR